MCLRKISTAIIACLILILLIPAFFDVVALADSGKPVHKKAIIVQPGEEVIVTDIASGPSPQEAEATGLDAAGGKGSVINGGAVLADAKADTTATAKGASAGARSVGISGSGGKDSILNNGTLSSKATSTITSLSLFINVDGFTLPFMRKFPPVIGGSLAESFAAGILGGNGNDSIDHSGIMTVEAVSTAAAGSINVNLTGRDEKIFSKAIPAVWAVKPPVMKADSSGKSVSEAVGIDGGSGADRILSTGPMTVKASATSGAGSLNMNLGNDARANLSAEATATATGVRGNEGNDTIINQGTITVEASAVAGAGAVTATYPTDRGIYGLPVNPPARSKVQIPFFKVQEDLSGKATAVAVGLSGSSGDDHIINIAPVDVTASATTGAGSISVGVGTGVEGDVSAEAIARAAGIRGGEGNDTIRNEGTLTVEAGAIAGAGSIAVGVSTEGGSAGAKADASGKATALSVGISGGSGDDNIVNIAPVTVKASSTVGAGSIAVSVGGNVVANVSAESMARAAGVRGGKGNDSIRNEGTLTVEASAIAGAGSIAVGVKQEDSEDQQDPAQTAPAAAETSPAKADAYAKATATALGIAGEAGHDGIVNIAPVDVTASAITGAGSISVGVGTGAEANVSAESTARAAGIRGGEGNDSIRNEGTLAVKAISIAGAGSIAVGIADSNDQENQAENPSASAASEASEASSVKADASAKATATASGIAGGPGRDGIVNIAPVDVMASATTGAGSIAVGVGTGAEANVSAESIARAAGIRGGEGSDTIRNEGILMVEARAIAGAGSIAVGVAGSDEGGSADAKADASGKAKAAAAGISGGSGDDVIVNVAPLIVRASSTVGAGSVAVSTGGDVEGNVSAGAVAGAAGIRGGSGDDEIVNQGTLAVKAKSVAVAGSIAVGVKGEDSDDQEKPPAPPKLETSTVKADASATSKAMAAGIDGGEGNNRITNTAPMAVTSVASTVAGSIAVNVSGLGGGDDGGGTPSGGGQEKPEMPELALSSAKTNASAKAEARAAGILSGAGFDTIASGGDIAVDATSHAVAAGVSVNVAKMDKGLSGSAALAEAGAEALSTAIGIDGGDGDNGITNSAAIGAKASATAVGVGVSVDVGLADKGAALGAAIADSSTTAEALATGIRSGAGQGRVVNTGVITPDAEAKATAVSVGLTVTNADKGLAASAALADANATATATARGIETGAGDDVIQNSGSISPKAKAGTTAVGVSLGVGVTEQGVSLGASLVESNATSSAAAVGIDSGKGSDRVSNTGQIALDSQSSATAVSVGLSVTYAKQGVGASVALVDAQSEADATARGIEAGDGDDRITNSGAIQGIAKADTTSVGVAVGVGIAKQGVAAGVGLSDTSTSARASAVGIDGGRGEDRIVNEGEIKLGLDSGFGSVADADAVSVTVTVAGASQGLAGAAALSKSSVTGVAQTTGIYGGEGRDEIRNAGKIDVGAKADVDSTNVAVGVTVAKEGLAGGAALSDASALATATAKGIDGAEGDDLIVNAGEIKARSESRADTVSVTATIAGAKTGLAGGAALSDASALATAAARGIEGAAGADRIFNESLVDTKAEAYADTTNVTVTIAGASTGLAGGAALSDTTSASVADAAGLSGGEGNDRISNKGRIVSGALADADATGVTATLTVAKEGLAAGAALSDTSSSAVSSSRGIDGGTGDDWIYNGAKVESKAEAYADTVSVTATISGTKTGVAGGASLSDSSAQTIAAARGIEGGAGHDRIRNEGEIDAKAISGADTTSVTVTVNGSLTGVAGGASLSDAAAGAIADASGISGGDGGDEIANAAKISAQATSDVDTTAVTVTLSVSKEGVAGGAALSDTSSSALSAARGIDGGAGNDRIWNEGVTEATSNAFADTTSVVVQVAGSLYGAAGGVSMSDSSAASFAQSTGILGGAGDDVIVNSSQVTARSAADVHATSVSVTVSGSIGLAAGAAFSDASVDSRALSRGIDGGDGNDLIVNQGEIVSGAGATGKSTSVSVNVALGAGGGATFSDSSALVSADATGIDGGAGHDRIVNTGPITANAASDADVSSVSVTVGAAVSAGASFGDASVVSDTAARGIAGGAGNDEIYNEGKIISGAMSRVDADSVSVNVGMGWAEATTAVTSVTTASGIEGGEGHDRIVNRGEIHVGPSPGLDPWMSRVAANSFSFNLAGAANAQSSMLAATKSTGIDGGAGNDKIHNEGLLSVLATSASAVAADSAIVFGASSGAVTSGAVAEAQGIAGGAGNDSVTNIATISANALSSIFLESSSFSFGGTGDTGGALVAISRSTGISGGDGSDFILNRGNVSATATSSLTSRAGATVVFGSSGAGSVAGSVTEATGISGGAGDDRIENSGALTVTATSGMTQSGSSFSFGGTGASGATLASTTLATGISGAEGADAILNRGSITLQAASTLTTDSNFSAAFGTSSGSVTSGGISQAIGIDGGAGDDKIWNSAAIVAGSSSALNLKASGFTFGGTSGANEALTADSRSVGLSGGAGANGIHNEGALTVTASSILTAKADVDAAFGTAVVNGITSASSTATGIYGGEKGDCIENLSVLTARAVSSVDIEKSAYVFGGTANAGGLAVTNANAVGIAAGDGDNRILNDLTGALDVKAVSTAKQSGSTTVTFGDPAANANVTAVASASGLTSGIGDDRVVNRATFVVDAYAKADGKTSADAFWGSPRAYDYTRAEATTTGIDAGDGNNVIISEGSIHIRAAAETLPDAKADSSVARTTSAATSSSTAKASGIVTGSGRDLILNRAELTVDAVAEKATAEDTKTKAFTDETAYIGTGPEAPGMTAEATAVGISAGDGGNVVVSEQAVKVSASATGDGEAHAHSNLYDTDAGVWGRVTSTATGIETGKGSSLVVNQGLLQVDANASAATISFSDSVDDATARGAATVEAKAWGIKAAGAESTDLKGATIVVNSAPISVNAESAAEGKTGRADSGWFGYGLAVTFADAKSEAWGITIGGSNRLAAVENSSGLTVKAKANSAASAYGDDESLCTADASATAIGIQIGGGNRAASIFNSGSITVDADAGVVFNYGLTDARSIGIDAGAAANRIVNAGSIGVTANAIGVMTRAEATGLRAGIGADQIENPGSFSVQANATALMGSSRTSATGFDAGGGDNRIFSDGVIDVRSVAVTGSAGEADAVAFGVRTGSGSDRIENRGNLSILAEATTPMGTSDASATGFEAGHGDNVIRIDGTLNVTARSAVAIGSARARAYGILTGEGNDTVTNAGRILTSQTGIATGVSIETPGIAISTGGGSDRIFLEAGSETRGIVDLGSGDDTISFNGSLTVTGNVTGGAGGDTLVFSGDGALGAPITGFETAIKDGPGTYSLSSLAQVKRLEMNGGTLAVNHSYQMTADGLFQARVNSDGSHGRLSVNGVAGLDGALNVVRGKGIYTNGTKYPILTANTVSGWFTSETLPAPSPLLSFKVTGFSDRVEVETLAKSVTTVATNPAQMRIAQMLDKAMATATGKTAEMLGEFQSLPAQDFQKAFASLNPGSYDRFRRASLTASQENVRSLHNRMTALRLTQPQYSAAIQAREMANTMSLFKTGPDSGMTPDQAWQFGRLSSAETRAGSWMNAFGQRGTLAGASGYAGSDYRMTGTVIGFDQRHGETFFTGYSSGFSRGEVGFEDRMGQGDVDGASSSIYGSWFANDTYLESALSFTRNRYSNHRSIVVGSLTQSATAEHEGNLFTAYLSGGRYVDLKQWVIEPYASILFNQADEEGFQETGGGLSLRIHDDRTRSLVSDVGLRVARSYEIPFGKLIPEAGIAWIYDFQLDERRITASLVDVGGSEFSIPGEQTGRHGARFETGLSWLGNSGFAASLKYTGEFRSGANDQGIFGYLRYEF